MAWVGMVSLWLGVCALWDLRTRTVPNILTLPVLVLAGLWRFLWEKEATLGWALLLALAWFGLWVLGAVGGADAKIALALSLLDPGWGYAAMVGLVLAGVWAKARRWQDKPLQDIPAVPFMVLTFPPHLAIIKASIVGVVRLVHEAPAMGFLF